MGGQDGGRSGFYDLIPPALFILAGFAVAGIGWVYLEIEPFLIIAFPVSVSSLSSPSSSRYEGRTPCTRITATGRKHWK